MKKLFGHIGLIAMSALGVAAHSQTAPDYTVYEDNPMQISSYAGKTADEWAQNFISLIDQSPQVPKQKLIYQTANLETLRLFIWTNLENPSVDLFRPHKIYAQKAKQLGDERNIKISNMIGEFLIIRDQSTSGDQIVTKVHDLTNGYAQDKDWFVVFFANSLNFEAHYLGEIPIDPNFAAFAQFALKGQESDLDYDEARLIYLSIVKTDQLRARDLNGFYETLYETANLRERFALPTSHFADLINAANLHHEIFTTPSSIQIAEKAFEHNINSPSNMALAEYTIASLYTAHGFSEQALEIYDSIDVSKLGAGGPYDQAINIDRALNHILLGDFGAAETALAHLQSGDVFFETKITQDLINIAMNLQTMTPVLAEHLLNARRTTANIVTLTQLDRPATIPNTNSNLSYSIDKTSAMHSGLTEDLRLLSDINQGRIQSFIDLAAQSRKGSTKIKPVDLFLITALQSFSSQNNAQIIRALRDYKNTPNYNTEIAGLFEAYRLTFNASTPTSTDLKIPSSENPLNNFVEYLLRARICLRNLDYNCAWQNHFIANQASKIFGQEKLTSFLLSDLELTLLSHEANTGKTLSLATDLFENQADFIVSADHANDIINRTASTFEAAGSNSVAHRLITLDGAAELNQPYANHLTDIRIMLSLSKFRQAKDRLETLGLYDGSLSQSIFQKTLKYAALAALGETDAALSLSEQIRAGSQGLKDPYLDKLIQPYLYMGDYYIYAHEKPFEAEQYRLQYLNIKRLNEIATHDKARLVSEARVRAINTSETRSLKTASQKLDQQKRRQALSNFLLLLLSGLTIFGLATFRKNRSELTLLKTKNGSLSHTIKTHEYFMTEMERHTALETAALTSAMDTISRSKDIDATIIAEKIGFHSARLSGTMSTLAYQDRLFTHKPGLPVKIDLEKLKTSLNDTWQQDASKKDVSILFDIDDRVRLIHSYKSLLSESLRLFVKHAIRHTSCDIIEIKFLPLRIKDQDYIRTTISDEGDGLSDFDSKMSPGDITPDTALSFDRDETEAFAAKAAIMAINGVSGRFESAATPGFGHILTFDLPATLISGAAPETTATNIVEFRKDSANDG